MPLVEINLLEGRSEAELDVISDTVHEAMVALLDVPHRDRFQIITERPPRSLRFDPNYLDIDRDNGFLLITLSAGRTTDAKQAFCRLAWRLRTRRIASQAGWSERAVTKTVEPYAHAVDERRLDEIDAAF